MLDTYAFSQAVAAVQAIDYSVVGPAEQAEQIVDLTAEWQVWLAADNDIAHLSERVQSHVFSTAYRLGIESGYGNDEVERYYRTLAAEARQLA